MKKVLIKITISVVALAMTLDVSLYLLFRVNVTPQLFFPVKAVYLTVSCVFQGKRPALVFVEDYLTTPSGCADRLPDGTWDRPIFIFMRGSDIAPGSSLDNIKP